ncbi:MAG: DEAD/DEAH box helicase [Proteobacteria bacterium]|nr:DEAD/DEAH box helicase [Pseudomonadota bacterium]
MSFETLGLRTELLRAVSDEGYTCPTPIQAQAIPMVLEGRDILAGSQTGTGKTASFALPILQKLGQSKSRNPKPRALILTPTRELAAQVEESFRSYGKHLNLRTAVIFGGVGIHPQIGQFRRGVDIVVATPGRLLDHAGQRTVDLSQVEILVLDEGDRMLDMGFIRDIRRIIALLPKKRQNMLFSATYSDDIKKLSDTLLVNPVRLEVTPRNTTVKTITQKVYTVASSRKRELLSSLIREGKWNQVLVFTRTKHGANKLTKQLLSDGVSAAAIHGNKSQAARTRALADFKAGEIRTLIATDIAARGLDINLLPHVVNYELPNVPEDYVHRIGRTGRAGANGIALSLVCAEEQKMLNSIQHLLKQKIEVEEIPGFQKEIRLPQSPRVPQTRQPQDRMKKQASFWKSSPGRRA